MPKQDDSEAQPTPNESDMSHLKPALRELFARHKQEGTTPTDEEVDAAFAEYWKNPDNAEELEKEVSHLKPAVRELFKRYKQGGELPTDEEVDEAIRNWESKKIDAAQMAQ